MACGTVGGDQNSRAKATPVGALHGPKTVRFELGPRKYSIFKKLGTDFDGASRDSLVADYAFDGIASRAGLGIFFFARTD